MNGGLTYNDLETMKRKAKTLLLAAFQSLESAQLRRQVTGVVETIAFVTVAISFGRLDGLSVRSLSAGSP